MSKLSWFIYLCDIIPNLGMLCVLLSSILGIGMGVWTILYISSKDDEYFNCPKPYTSLYMLLTAVTLTAVLVPSSKTLYMIAASEASQQVLASPQVKDIEQKLLNRLNDYLTEKKDSK